MGLKQPQRMSRVVLTWHPAVMGIADDDSVGVCEGINAERGVEVDVVAVEMATG